MKGRGHCGFNLGGAGLLMHADHLLRPRRIDGANLVLSFQAIAADDQAVLGAKMRGDVVERAAHGVSILGIAEIGERLIGKHAPRCARLNRGRNAGEDHDGTSLVHVQGVQDR